MAAIKVLGVADGDGRAQVGDFYALVTAGAVAGLAPPRVDRRC